MGMRRLFAALFCLWLTLCSTAGTVAPASAGRVSLLRTMDGDSFVLRIDDHVEEVRLLNVDCPEYRQEYWCRAEAFTVAFLLSGQPELEYGDERVDRFGRTLAWVRVKGRMLNLELVRHGLALPVYLKRHSRYADRFRAALREAQTSEAGFWAQGGLKMTPRQFRRSRR